MYCYRSPFQLPQKSHTKRKMLQQCIFITFAKVPRYHTVPPFPSELDVHQSPPIRGFGYQSPECGGCKVRGRVPACVVAVVGTRHNFTCGRRQANGGVAGTPEAELNSIGLLKSTAFIQTASGHRRRRRFRLLDNRVPSELDTRTVPACRTFLETWHGPHPWKATSLRSSRNPSRVIKTEEDIQNVAQHTSKGILATRNELLRQLLRGPGSSLRSIILRDSGS